MFWCEVDDALAVIHCDKLMLGTFVFNGKNSILSDGYICYRLDYYQNYEFKELYVITVFLVSAPRNTIEIFTKDFDYIFAFYTWRYLMILLII